MERSWLTDLAGLRAGRAPRRARPRLETLEERAVPALVITDLNSTTSTTLAQTFATPGVTVSGVTFQGENTSAGSYSGGTGIIGIESGIVLSTGDANDVVGPNNVGDTSTQFVAGTGDADLDALASPQSTDDATVLEFDFVPPTGQITFSFVFTSDEYNENVGANRNDVFGAFLNGTNLALVPSTSSPITVDTINASTNSTFYINNAEASDPNPAPTPLLDTEADGLTTVLTVTANVNAGVSNHIKLAIADAGDNTIDSNVFIGMASYPAAPPGPTPPFPTGPTGPTSFVALTAFRPYRYAFRSLEENMGITGPLPPAGVTASRESFDGNITVVNLGTRGTTGTVQVTLRNLPQDVQLLNRTGTDPRTGDPFIIAGRFSLAPGGTVPLRVPVKLSNPNNLPLGTFFVAPYDIIVTVT